MFSCQHSSFPDSRCFVWRLHPKNVLECDMSSMCGNHIFSVKLSGLSLAAEPEGSRGVAARNIPRTLRKPQVSSCDDDRGGGKGLGTERRSSENHPKVIVNYIFVLCQFSSKESFESSKFLQKSYVFFSAFVSGPKSCNTFHRMQGLRLHQCHQAPKRWQRPRQWSVKNRGGVSDHPKGLIQMDATYISNDTMS